MNDSSTTEAAGQPTSNSPQTPNPTCDQNAEGCIPFQSTTWGLLLQQADIDTAPIEPPSIVDEASQTIPEIVIDPAPDELDTVENDSEPDPKFLTVPKTNHRGRIEEKKPRRRDVMRMMLERSVQSVKPKISIQHPSKMPEPFTSASTPDSFLPFRSMSGHLLEPVAAKDAAAAETNTNPGQVTSGKDKQAPPDEKDESTKTPIATKPAPEVVDLTGDDDKENQPARLMRTMIDKKFKDYKFKKGTVGRAG
ncbi:hypothetical protein PRZ48_008827 [Zasmidium cellare]|uniref:Uncharacterized protein n=1 Tax=Zasmidium cellare TaxID=395010 RepID=A0ABR0EHN3_ZASCE|nr:hypothetical protein PRZ48_008827 [Zasmidium cellare]